MLKKLKELIKTNKNVEEINKEENKYIANYEQIIKNYEEIGEMIKDNTKSGKEQTDFILLKLEEISKMR